MPAAELTRLRSQINKLIELFSDPSAFRSALRDLLELYANRAYRPGQSVQPQPLLPSYRVPLLVTRQLEMELGKTCQEQPEAALDVVEALWRDSYLEPRLLATNLLGAIPVEHAAEVIQKIRAWARPDESSRMLDALFQSATNTLRRSAPKHILLLSEDWLSSMSLQTQALGIRILVPLIRDAGFENLPVIFRLLSPLMQSVPSALQTDLQIAIEALASQSATETAYFLRQALSMSSGKNITRLIRRCLPLFNDQQQASLRAALQAANPG